MFSRIKRITFVALLACMIFGKIQQPLTQTVLASEYAAEPSKELYLSKD